MGGAVGARHAVPLQIQPDRTSGTRLRCKMGDHKGRPYGTSPVERAPLARSRPGQNEVDQDAMHDLFDGGLVVGEDDGRGRHLTHVFGAGADLLKDGVVGAGEIVAEVLDAAGRPGRNHQ